jgi:ribosomal protein L29
MANEHHTKTVEHLKKEVGDVQEKLRTIRFGGAGSRSRNVKEGRNLRREVARMLTELRARELVASKTKTA